MSEKTKTKVYLLVEAEVQDGGVVNGDVAVSRAARTLSDLISGGTEEIDARGMSWFHSHGEVAMSYPSILPYEVMAYIDARRKAKREYEMNCGEDGKPFVFGPWLGISGY